MTPDQLAEASEDITKYVNSKYPMELYESGALLLSIGSFLVANAVPGLWPQMKDIALLSRQLLEQEKNQKIAEVLKDTNTQPEPSRIIIP